MDKIVTESTTKIDKLEKEEKPRLEIGGYSNIYTEDYSTSHILMLKE